MILDTNRIKPTKTNRSFHLWKYRADNPPCPSLLERCPMQRRHAARTRDGAWQLTEPRTNTGPPGNISILDDAVI
jgi:hypothetical protein